MPDEQNKLSRLTVETIRRHDMEAARLERGQAPAPEVSLSHTERQVIEYADQALAGDREKLLSLSALMHQWKIAISKIDSAKTGDPMARSLIDEGFEVLRGFTMLLGPRADFDHAARLRLHAAAQRLLNEGRPPGWRPDR